MSSSLKAPWYHGITSYQWLVLAIASTGWVFDAFEGQIFGVTRREMLADILQKPMGDPEVRRWGDIMLAIFQLGGTCGGLLFSSLADKWGRRPVMSLTIIFYSVFSGLTYFATDLWHVGVLRFFVAMGVGGEWAVAAALVAEVFPKSARDQAASLFHSSSIVGVWLAAAVGLLVGSNWRLAYLMSILPVLLVLWVRQGLKEPESWQSAKATVGARMGSFRELLGIRRWRLRALGGMALAAIGMATFWGVTVAGLDLMRDMLIRHGVDSATARSQAQIAYAYVQGTGGALGMFFFGPISARIGWRNTFRLFHGSSLIIVLMICWLPQTPLQLLVMMPVMGFFTFGIHSGYAVYFPQLFPNHLRATGAGFCFNAGRLLSAGVLFLSGSLKASLGLPVAITILAGFFLLGLLMLFFLPETEETI